MSFPTASVCQGCELGLGSVCHTNMRPKFRQSAPMEKQNTGCSLFSSEETETDGSMGLAG